MCLQWSRKNQRRSPISFTDFIHPIKREYTVDAHEIGLWDLLSREQPLICHLTRPKRHHSLHSGCHNGVTNKINHEHLELLIRCHGDSELRIVDARVADKCQRPLRWREPSKSSSSMWVPSKKPVVLVHQRRQ